MSSAAPADPLLAARRLTPLLAERAAATEASRRIPPATLAQLRADKLFRLMQPARVGGLERDLGTLLAVCAELARGCAATAWVVGNLASHHWMLGMWPPQAQDDVWGESPDALIAASLIFPAGRATPIDGGYRLRGKWSFASGVDACQWVMLGGIVGGEDEEHGEYRLFLLPRGECRIEDNWFAAGLAGTGSKGIIIDDAIVPAYRTLALADTNGGATPGSIANPAPLYRVPLLATFGYVVAGVPLGIAEGMLTAFTAASRSRLAAHSGRALTDFQPVQHKLAEASALTETARLLLSANCADITTMAAAGVPPLDTKARWRRDAAFAARLALRAVDLLFEAAGGAALFLANPAQRAFRDAHAAVAHIALNWDAAAAVYGLVALGHSAELPPYER